MSQNQIKLVAGHWGSDGIWIGPNGVPTGRHYDGFVRHPHRRGYLYFPGQPKLLYPMMPVARNNPVVEDYGDGEYDMQHANASPSMASKSVECGGRQDRYGQRFSSTRNSAMAPVSNYEDAHNQEGDLVEEDGFVDYEGEDGNVDPGFEDEQGYIEDSDDNMAPVTSRPEIGENLNAPPKPISGPGVSIKNMTQTDVVVEDEESPYKILPIDSYDHIEVIGQVEIPRLSSKKDVEGYIEGGLLTDNGELVLSLKNDSLTIIGADHQKHVMAALDSESGNEFIIFPTRIQVEEYSSSYPKPLTCRFDGIARHAVGEKNDHAYPNKDVYTVFGPRNTNDTPKILLDVGVHEGVMNFIRDHGTLEKSKLTSDNVITENKITLTTQVAKYRVDPSKPSEKIEIPESEVIRIFYRKKFGRFPTETNSAYEMPTAHFKQVIDLIDEEMKTSSMPVDLKNLKLLIQPPYVRSYDTYEVDDYAYYTDMWSGPTSSVKGRAVYNKEDNAYGSFKTVYVRFKLWYLPATHKSRL